MNQLEPTIISEFQRNADEKVRLGLKAYKGKVYFDLRIWFPDKETGALIPSKKGICLNLDHLPQMRDFLDTLESVKTRLPEDLEAAEVSTAESRQTQRREPAAGKAQEALTPATEKRYERPKQFK